jgi:hypothetical protein
MITHIVIGRNLLVKDGNAHLPAQFVLYITILLHIEQSGEADRGCGGLR